MLDLDRLLGRGILVQFLVQWISLVVSRYLAQFSDQDLVRWFSDQDLVRLVVDWHLVL